MIPIAARIRFFANTSLDSVLMPLSLSRDDLLGYDALIFALLLDSSGRPYMAKTIRPLNDRILVQRLEAEQKTAGGILIPDNAKEKPAEGRVIAVGNGKFLRTATVVLWKSKSATEFSSESGAAQTSRSTAPSISS